MSSRQLHDNAEAFRVDRARQNNAIRRGWAILRYIDDVVELCFDWFIDEICSTIDWLLGQPLRTGARMLAGRGWRDAEPLWGRYGSATGP